MNDRSGRTHKRAEMFEGLSSLGTRLKAKHLEEAIESARQGDYLEAAAKFGQSGVSPGQQLLHTKDLAYAFYKRALTHQSDMNKWRAIADLETALQFPSLPRSLRSLVQQRLTVVRKGSDVEIRKFDEAIAQQFDRRASDIELRGEFLRQFGLSQANRSPKVDGVDEVSTVGVYRWVGDANRDEQWSQLIRKFKKGDAVLPAFFGRILAEHVRATSMCNTWIREVDYIVPVPAAARRTAERGINILATTAQHLSSRLGVPSRTDFLKRNQGSERSRFVGKKALACQYAFSQKMAEEIRGRTVLLLDDVMNRGHTAGVCASRLIEFGCSRVVLLVLALAESSLQSSRHVRQAES
ncbi:MAG: phosphoribosyltransferase [Deltaproteobacteria bacterium]|nr:phosphoribosyltransferase [Deltaproteobacteria bacterium]